MIQNESRRLEAEDWKTIAAGSSQSFPQAIERNNFEGRKGIKCKGKAKAT